MTSDAAWAAKNRVQQALEDAGIDYTNMPLVARFPDTYQIVLTHHPDVTVSVGPEGRYSVTFQRGRSLHLCNGTKSLSKALINVGVCIEWQRRAREDERERAAEQTAIPDDKQAE
jgi:hypothetical protein